MVAPKRSTVSGQVAPDEPQASCKQCVKSSVCAILRNQIALAKQFPRLDQKPETDLNGEPKPGLPMFDPFSIALTCTEYFPPDVRLFADMGAEGEEDLR